MVINKVFVDSNFFIALFNPADNLHLRAIRASRKIEKDGFKLVLSNFIFLEVVTILSQKLSRRSATIFGKQLLSDRYLQLVHINRKLNGLSWQIFSDVKNKNISFVDCSCLAVMKAEEVKLILTFDKKDFQPLAEKYNFNIYQ